MQLLDEAQSDLFYYVDRSHIYELLYPNDYANYIENDFENQIPFNFDYYKNPPIYAAYPKEKKTYLKFLKSWLLDSIESRRAFLGCETVPNAYQNLLTYANNLLPAEESAKQEVSNNPLQIAPAPESIEAQVYPAHIFNTFKAYKLFQTFMEVYKTPAQIGFIYRTMAEKENPPCILVKDTVFRNWFNGEHYPIKLHEHTKTYINAKNQDRIDAYNIVKRLISSQS